jgi:hypothetical protein
MDPTPAAPVVLPLAGVGSNTLLTLQRLVTPFFEQGAEAVFLSVCCGRLYVGLTPPIKCRTCGTTAPPSHRLGSIVELEFVKIGNSSE